jgi:hypothetical protein
MSAGRRARRAPEGDGSAVLVFVSARRQPRLSACRVCG